MSTTLGEILRALDAVLVIEDGPEKADLPIDIVYVGDRMSELLQWASPRALIVTRLSGPHLVRLAELLDSPALCVLGTLVTDPRLIDAARAAGMIVARSSLDPAEAVVRLSPLVETVVGGEAA